MNAPVTAGSVLAGKYRVDRVLGEGGMGIVVAATDLQLERRVAIKFLLPEYAEHVEAAQRFLREARAAVKIQSEHVARVIDVGTMETGSPYMVMEYLEGRDLSALVDAREVLSIEDAVAHVLEACDAIAEAHSVGIVHRDLKPANLFLALQPDGSTRVKVLDFGISKAVVAGGATDPSLTRTSSMMGSPLYMSPEQMKSAKNVDPRTDVWALGIILYELLTLEPPFYAESIPELSAMVLLDDPPSLRALREEIPVELEEVVLRALQKLPANRYDTVADLANALAPFGPARTRANVERASRVLRTSQLRAGTPPPRAPSATPPTAKPPAPISAIPQARTVAAWSEASGAKKPGKGRGALIGVVALAGLAIVVFIVSRSASKAEPPPVPAAAQMAPVPAPVAAPTTPLVEATAPAPAPATALPTMPSSESATTAHTKATKGGPHAKPVAAKPAGTPAATPPATPAPAAADPFSGFGSRK